MKHHYLITICIAALMLLVTGCARQGDKSSGVVTVNGVELPYFIEGEGIPCIIAGDALATSHGLSKELRRHFKFIITDFRMNLPSEKLDEIDKITLDTFIDDVEQVRKALGFDKICVLGHSISGLLALEYARKYPEHTSNVIMNGTPPYWNAKAERIGNEYWISHASDDRKLILKQNWENLPEDTLSNLSPGDADMLAYFTNAPKYWYDPRYDCSWIGEGVYWNMEVWDQLFSVIMADYDIAKGDQTTTPVFLSLGKYDYVVPYYLWDDKKDKLLNLTFHLFEKSGHWAMLEQQALFDSLLIDWIKNQPR